MYALGNLSDLQQIAEAPASMLSPTEEMCLQYWLIALALFELPSIYGLLVTGTSLNGFFSTLANKEPEKRVWSMVLCFLVFARVQAAAFPDHPGALWHNSAVHILEAAFFG